MAATNPNLLVALLLAALAVATEAQNCGCAPDFCCSKYGYCGKGVAYCGDGCQSGPCLPPLSRGSVKSGGGGFVSLADVVTPQFFNGIIGNAAAVCPGKGFYSRQAFLNAAAKYSGFGNAGTVVNSKREIAAFFANVAHETGYLCYKEERDQSNAYCNDKEFPQYPCAPGKKYYGRGPLQISWNYNYALAGKDIGFDGLGSPETVATDPNISFMTALWLWMNNVHEVVHQGFGATIRAINADLECNGRNPVAVNDRVSLYKTYCQAFGVTPGENLIC